MEQNKAFQQVNNYEEMVSIIYLSPEETPDNAKPVLLQDIMQRLAQSFPTFVIAKGTDMELGRRLTKMGYDSKRQNKGSAFRIMQRPS